MSSESEKKLERVRDEAKSELDYNKKRLVNIGRELRVAEGELRKAKAKRDIGPKDLDKALRDDLDEMRKEYARLKHTVVEMKDAQDAKASRLTKWKSRKKQEMEEIEEIIKITKEMTEKRVKKTNKQLEKE